MIAAETFGETRPIGDIAAAREALPRLRRHALRSSLPADLSAWLQNLEI